MYRMLTYAREQCHDFTYDIIYSEVFHSQRIQYDSARVQRHHHHKEHSEVKLQRILCYSLVIICCLS